MTENINFRITVDLSAFFYDHRRLARIFIKNSIKTVRDLQNRISHIFGIEDFFLVTGGHFLPDSEDIRILQNGEIISVVPNNKHVAESQVLNLEHDKVRTRKRFLKTITEECEEIPSTKEKVKKKQKHNEDTSPSSSEQEIKSKKEKASQKSNILENETIHNKKYKSKADTVEEKICVIESAQMVRNIAKKFKHKNENCVKNNSDSKEETSIKNILPKLQNHIKSYNSSGRTNLPDTVRLSRHTDTPIKHFSKYTPPPRITDTYLAKNKVNIVKIDVIKKDSEVISNSHASNITDENCMNLQKSTPQKSSVKEIVDSFENLSPEEKNENMKKASETSPNSVEIQKSNSPNEENDVSQACDNNANVTTDYNMIFKYQSTNYNTSFTDTEGNKTVLTEVEMPSLTQDIKSPDISSLVVENDSSINGKSENTFNLTNDSLNLMTACHSNNKRQYSGLGFLLENLRESESVVFQENVTKRKRIRKHKRKNKKLDEDKSFELPLPPKEINVMACPKIHIKFEHSENTSQQNILNENNVQTVNRDVSENIDLTENDANLSTKEMLLAGSEEEELVLQNAIFNERNIMNSPLMGAELQPKEKDIIAFKIFRISKDYTPQISDYIVGKVETYFTENQTIYFKILSGEQETLPPSGKLSLNLDDLEALQNSKFKTFCWPELLEPRLLYP